MIVKAGVFVLAKHDDGDDVIVEAVAVVAMVVD